MFRTQVYLTEKQNKDLKAIAAYTGRSQSELIRQAVEQFVAAQEQQEERWKAAIRQARGMWANRPEVEEEIREMRRGITRRMERLFGEDENAP